MSAAPRMAGGRTIALWNDKSLREGPVFPTALRSKVTVLGPMGRIEAAKQFVPALLELEPHLRCSHARYAAGLRAPGIPE